MTGQSKGCKCERGSEQGKKQKEKCKMHNLYRNYTHIMWFLICGLKEFVYTQFTVDLFSDSLHCQH